MRKSKQEIVRAERLASFFISLLAGVGALAVTAMIMSFFAALLDISDSGISALSGIALAAGCFACAFCAANRRRRHGLLFGFMCGIIVFLGVVIIGVLTVKVFTARGIFVKLLIILSASAIGGIKGVNTRPFL